MKVKELVEILLFVDQDLEVGYTDNTSEFISVIHDVGKVETEEGFVMIALSYDSFPKENDD